jgi:hypothetical protein
MREVGRELKVSELVPHTVVVLEKPGRPLATMWVMGVSARRFVHFFAGVTQTNFLAERTGEDGEWITDDSGIAMKMYKYLGRI